MEIGPDVSRVILLVDGIFAQIPYHALPIGDVRLYEKLDINTISNPYDLYRANRAIGIAQSDGSAVIAVDDPELPMIRFELDEISQSFERAELITGSGATVHAATEALSKCGGFVHIATHASRSSENPLFSKLVLVDGPLYPFDLFEHGIAARLVVLSGCQTAAPGIYYGNTYSLAKAFYKAGARFVLASLWPVSDKFVRLFMRSFYRALGNGNDISSAYCHALAESRKINSDESFWASFFLLGL